MELNCWALPWSVSQSKQAFFKKIIHSVVSKSAAAKGTIKLPLFEVGKGQKKKDASLTSSYKNFYCPWINCIKKIHVSQTEAYSDTKLVC